MVGGNVQNGGEGEGLPELEGKTIVGARFWTGREFAYDDEMVLTFTDGTSVLITGSYRNDGQGGFSWVLRD